MKNFDWNSRKRNAAFWTMLVLTIVPFVYQILGILGVVSPISQNEVIVYVGLALNFLIGIGVLMDPTTPGVTDGNNMEAVLKAIADAATALTSREDIEQKADEITNEMKDRVEAEEKLEDESALKEAK